MGWYSTHGTGAIIYGVTPAPDARVEFTAWLCLFFVPLVPISSWSAVYAGELPSDGVFDDRQAFADLRRTPHRWDRIGRTFLVGWATAGAAILPALLMIALTNGRAATPMEMVLVFVACGWALGLVFWIESRRRRRLRESWTIAAGDAPPRA